MLGKDACGYIGIFRDAGQFTTIVPRHRSRYTALLCGCTSTISFSSREHSEICPFSGTRKTCYSTTFVGRGRQHLDVTCASLQVRAALRHDSSSTVPAHMVHVDLLFWRSQIKVILHLAPSRTTQVGHHEGSCSTIDASSACAALCRCLPSAFLLHRQRHGDEVP